MSMRDLSQTSIDAIDELLGGSSSLRSISSQQSWKDSLTRANDYANAIVYASTRAVGRETAAHPPRPPSPRLPPPSRRRSCADVHAAFLQHFRRYYKVRAFLRKN